MLQLLLLLPRLPVLTRLRYGDVVGGEAVVVRHGRGQPRVQAERVGLVAAHLKRIDPRIFLPLSMV